MEWPDQRRSLPIHNIPIVMPMDDGDAEPTDLEAFAYVVPAAAMRLALVARRLLHLLFHRMLPIL